ncbi:MAG: helix-turn-helix transcriptional regulator [Clostridia bacterium]|nr:helix-turn-helix transcriptional regulator [Clostridia bacterium]
MLDFKEVAGRIKELRETKGYSQEDLAKLTGVSVDEYGALKQGNTDFSFTFIYKGKSFSPRFVFY